MKLLGSREQYSDHFHNQADTSFIWLLYLFEVTLFAQKQSIKRVIHTRIQIAIITLKKRHINIKLTQQSVNKHYIQNPPKIEQKICPECTSQPVTYVVSLPIFCTFTLVPWDGPSGLSRRTVPVGCFRHNCIYKFPPTRRLPTDILFLLSCRTYYKLMQCPDVLL